MDAAAFEAERIRFEEREDARMDQIDETSDRLDRAFAFMSRTFGEGQEMVLFLVALGRDYYAKRFLADCGNDAYAKYSRTLLLKEGRERLKQDILSVAG
jgi:hypothetical protein